MKKLLLLFCFLAAPALESFAEPARPGKIGTVLFVGNSITQHAPASELGWPGRWGMAASKAENDYVHLLVARMAEAQGAAPRVLVHAIGGGSIAGKLEDTEALSTVARQADLIVVQMGENDHQQTADAFGRPYEAMLRLLREASPKARIVCTGVWAPPGGNGTKDRFIRQLCADLGFAFADLAAANRAPGNRAGSTGLWTHAGVNWHPSDAGMRAYSDAIWSALAAGPAGKPPASRSSSAAAAPSAPVQIFRETFPSPEALDAWKPRVAAHTYDGPAGIASAAKIESLRAEDIVTARRALPISEYVGRTVTVTARIKTSGISTPPKAWNGVKVMLAVQNAEGVYDFPQATVAADSEQPWREVSFTRFIPDNTVGLALVVGLERVSGTLWVTDIRITDSR